MVLPSFEISESALDSIDNVLCEYSVKVETHPVSSEEARSGLLAAYRCYGDRDEVVGVLVHRSKQNVGSIVIIVQTLSRPSPSWLKRNVSLARIVIEKLRGLSTAN